ncbi:MAG: SET domain-containing protein-lysine N-methyltransferase [Rhizobiaceae bacterium]|nr:SET domain-containing protein-lysine N-methyltransferase [Rhizobiaceae bacterium]
MLRISTYVAASSIEGVGVFAAEPVVAGTLIWRFEPDFDLLVPLERYRKSARHVRELLDRYAYPSPDRPGFLVYETDNGRFMNHAADANTDFSVHGGGTASRAIAVGEEITCDYGEFFPGFSFHHGHAGG